MRFQSFPFIFLFLPAVLILYWSLPSLRWRYLLLTIASYVFYGWWDYRFCGLLLLSSLIDFAAGGLIAKSESPRARKAWLVLAVSCNLTILGFFKYWDFFADSLNRVLALLGAEASAPLFHLILPVGLSFYTFQTMSYTIDIYRGQVRPARSLLTYLAYVSLFPQLVMGPIVRWSEVEEQMEAVPRRLDYRRMALGWNIFIVGLAKKVLVADNLWPRVDPSTFPGMSFTEFWPAFFCWNYWLYFDFSSYSDMAVGLGLMLAIRFPQNFNSPYRAESVGEYWRRWNMTLGRFMRDYVFFPLGGSRLGLGRLLVNILIVFFLIGLWHGANWNMVLWGMYMGMGVVGETLLRRAGVKLQTRWFKRLLLFLFSVNAGWMFRATDLSMTRDFFRAGFGENGLGGWPDPLMIGLLILITLHHQLVPNLGQWKWRFSKLEAALLAALFLLCVSRLFVQIDFFYFQF